MFKHHFFVQKTMIRLRALQEGETIFWFHTTLFDAETSRILFPVEGGRVKGEGREGGGGGEREMGDK